VVLGSSHGSVCLLAVKICGEKFRPILVYP